MKVKFSNRFYKKTGIKSGTVYLLTACLIFAIFSFFEVKTVPVSGNLDSTAGKRYPEPDLAEHPDFSAERMVYLTYDDGPSVNTEKLLDILKEENVKATFFVMGGNSDYEREILCRIVEEGHAIGVHSYSHKYSKIYKSVDAFLDDFNTEYNIIKVTTGVEPKIFRFPGGSVNSYNAKIYQNLVDEMSGRGFVFFDWNAVSDDSLGNISKDRQLAKLKSKVGKYRILMPLMHDAKQNTTTPEVTREYIKILKENGYNFGTLNETIPPVQFSRK